MANSSNTPERQIIRNVDVAGQRVNIWRPRALTEVLPLILSKTNQHIFIPDFDVLNFVLPDPNLFRVTDVYSDDELRGFKRVGNTYTIVGGEDSEYVLYFGRAQQDVVSHGIALPRDSRFSLLQTFLDKAGFETEAEKARKKIEKEYQNSRRPLTTKELKNQSGKTRLS